MELKIIGKPLAVCRVDMNRFKNDYKKELDLGRSIRKNFKVMDRGKFDEELLFNYVCLGLNWGRILDLMNDIDKDEMVIRVFGCEIKDKIEYVPELVSEDGRLFILKQRVKNGYDTIMINSFLDGPDFMIDSYMKSTAFNFGKVRWKPMIELGSNGKGRT